MNNRRREWFKNGNQALPYTPPLDLYTGASLAIGPRKLRTAYMGPCMRIALLSNTAIQTDINFLPNGYVDEAAIIAFAGTGSAIMRTYYDQSGNGNNLIFPLSVNVATIVSSGVIEKVNGKIGFFHNAGNSNIQFTLVTVISFFVVYKILSIQPANYILWNSTNNSEGIYLGGTFGGVNGFGVVQGGAIRVQNTIENTNQNLGSYVGDTIDSVKVNGGNLATAPTLFPNIQANRLGRSDLGLSFNGTIQEVIIYSTNQESNRSNIESNINSYYSIY